MSDDFCILHGYDHMKFQFQNPIPYCEACDLEREREREISSNAPDREKIAALLYMTRFPHMNWFLAGPIETIFAYEQADAVLSALTDGQAF